MDSHDKNNAVAIPPVVDCNQDPTGSLLSMFVTMVQEGRIARGQSPALRPVFLKPHGVAHGVFRIRDDLPSALRLGIFVGREYPVWVRFSSDTLPIFKDYETTLGIAIKLFNVPGEKIFGAKDDQTFDFVLQNSDVFFVDNATDMCAFTRASLIDNAEAQYRAAHPDTDRILKQMQKQVPSALSTAYWSSIPFAFGDRFVKYKLSPTLSAAELAGPPADPSYLAADLHTRLKASEARFVFALQFQTDASRMPLDRATVAWSEEESPPVPVAELILPMQDLGARGQAEYGENLSWNVWRVTPEHRPQGSIAEVRRVIYAASADVRRNVNGVPLGEPQAPRPAIHPALGKDRTIVRAAIHPAIGIARVGDSEQEFLVGPEVCEPEPASAESYRDRAGCLKRQAARFRIFGYNAAGEVVRELTADNAQIEWTVHLANQKAQWFRFIAALDIPETAKLTIPRRNATVMGADRAALMIDPGPRRIEGASAGGESRHKFDTGRFETHPVDLGELRTDKDGHLLVLGGRGKSASPSYAPIFSDADPATFANADDWYDDTSDGPVTAHVAIDGRAIPVEGAWVVVAPPNYAPDFVGLYTLYDLLTDVYIECGWLPVPHTVSFARDVLPILTRLSRLQWLNEGFATAFGRRRPFDFEDPAVIAQLAHAPTGRLDPYHELRRLVFHSFRPSRILTDEMRLWPWIYGDGVAIGDPANPRVDLSLRPIQELRLQLWADGQFVNDWDPHAKSVRVLEDVPLHEQPAVLDCAALQFCLADAFHPGCEVTWPIRHASLFAKPFRIKHRAVTESEPDYGTQLTAEIALSRAGPLHEQGPGGLTRWMAVPWQGDTAFCRSGYDAQYDPYLPTFWPARVPNQVLSAEAYQIVMDSTRSREERLAAFNTRCFWTRAIDDPGQSIAQWMLNMVERFGGMGVIEQRPGLPNDPDFPEVMYVESLRGSRLHALLEERPVPVATARPPTAFERAGWDSAEQLEEARRARSRGQR
jgi:hypothetical protein